MGVASDVWDLRTYVEVDYRKTVAEVYEETARYLLEKVGPNGPETFFRHADDRRQQQNLASWAPDWSVTSNGLVPMFKNNTTSTRQLDPKPHYTFLGRPLVLAYIGYEVDVIRDFSLMLPDPSQLETSSMEKYHQAANNLEAFYNNGTGVWWSGDENGQHRHVSFRGREQEHEMLCRIIGDEWLNIMGALSRRNTFQDELETHKRFVATFKDWMESRERQQLIMVGSDSDRLESIMWRYLKSIENSLQERRFAVTNTGRIGIVPKQVQSGDIVVYLAGCPISYVFRRDLNARSQNLDVKIREILGGSGGQIGLVDDMAIQNCTLVGECYVDGEVGWKKSVSKECEPKYTIYALR